ncbi:uncharacterized protein LOC143255217 [Tachypleus tridentatus]|uniref:uncharacterized protein LOC143255217 n=1 Tax=Tachypleus tridentatus TaxID=6853 RepID=UPI003FCF2E20
MESQSNGRPSSRTTTSPDHDGTSNETSDILRWLMLNRLEVSQVPERGNFIVKPPRANHKARARKRFRSVALTSAASISTRREYVGTDVFIVIGLGITFVGTAIALVGFFVPFGNTELRPLVLGIGLAVVATGLIVAGVRIFNCRPYKIRTCCCSKAERFPHLRKAFVHPVPMRISISSVSSSASSLRTLNKDNSTFIIPHSDKSKIMLKSSFRSSSKPVTANTVNFNPTVGEFSVENGSKELAWHSEISLISEELSKKIITNQDPSSYLELRTPLPSKP